MAKAERRAEYAKKGERDRRTHRFCTRGGAIESLLPESRDFSEVEFHNLMEMIFSGPQVQNIVESHINHWKRRKGDADG